MAKIDEKAVELLVEKFAEVILAAKADKISELSIGAAVSILVALIAGSEENVDSVMDFAKRNLAAVKKGKN